MPTSMSTVATANITKTIKVAMIAGAKPSWPSAKTQSGMPMYPVLEYDALKPEKLAATTSRLRTQLTTNTERNTSRQLRKKAVIKPGCQSVCQLLLDAKLNNCAGKASQTTKRFNSIDALSPNLPVLPQM